MIPVKDVIPPRSTPWAAMTLLVLGTVEFVVERWLDAPGRLSFFGLIANIVAMWIFADNVEDRLGRGRFVACYAAANAIGALATAMFVEWSALPLLLASGAVAGVIGAYAVLFPGSRVLMFFPVPLDLYEVPALFFLCTFVILQLPAGVAGFSEVAAGLATGAMLGRALRRPVHW